LQNGRPVAVTVLVTLVVIALLGAVFVFSGLYNVSAAQPHTGFVKGLLSTISDRSIDTHAKKMTPPPVDSAGLLEGAEHFHEMCVVCHGAPGVAKDEIAEGLNPRAPELSRHAAGEFSESQLFWIIKNGIKFTGMPGFGQSHTDEQIWEMTAFVKRMDKMTAAQYEAVIRAVKAANGGELPDHEGGHDEHEMNMGADSAGHHH
jgi:mono/diheme cytochrome c family protein